MQTITPIRCRGFRCDEVLPMPKSRILLMNLADARYRSSFLTEHLGFGYLAAALRRGGHEVTWIDEHSDGALDPQTFPFRDHASVDIVGLGASCATYRRALAWLKAWRRHSPNAVTVIGGQHVMLVPDRVLRETNAVDLVCLGEGEAAMAPLADAVAAKTDPRDVPGFAWRDGDIVRFAPPALVADLDALAWPDRDVLQRWIAQRRLSQVSLQNSRGCPYNCRFCHLPAIRNSGYGYAHRFRSPQSVVGELVALQRRFGFREFFFNSPQWLAPGAAGIQWARELCEQLRAARRDLRIEIECRADLLDDEDLVRELAQAGVIRVFLGLEGGSDDMLARYRKGVTTATLARVAALLRTHGISISGSGFIMFHPLSTLGDLRANAEFLWSLGETHLDSLWSQYRMFPAAAENDAILAAGLADADRAHDDVFGYRFVDPGVAWLNAHAPALVSGALVERARRVVLLADILIGLEEANLPAIAPSISAQTLASLLDLRGDLARLRDAVQRAFFDHFLFCLHLASRTRDDDAASAGAARLTRNLTALRPAIDAALATHDELVGRALRVARRTAA